MSHFHENMQPIILTGMHRSGTSLAASILRAGGVHMGDCLVQANRWNRRGYFEDVDFLEFHRDLLRTYHLSDRGWTMQQPVVVSEDFVERAQGLGSLKKSRNIAWGWKDPRTTLFLELWHGIFPDAQFLFVFRNPWSVIDSLFRRGTDSEVLLQPRSALDFWVHYNRLICDFLGKYPHQCALVSIDQISRNPANLITLLNNRFGRTLSPQVQECIDLRLLHRDAYSWRAILISNLASAARATYERLNALALLPDRPWPEVDDCNMSQMAELFFEEWKCLRERERAFKRLKREVARRPD